MLLVDFGSVLFVGAILILLERLMPLHPDQQALRRGWRVDIMHLFVSGMIIRVGMTFVVIVLSFLSISIAPDWIREAVRSQPAWLQFIEVLVLSDIFFYLAHRMCHAVPFLWRFHAVHHSSEQMDWLATYRVHPVDQIINSTMIALPSVLLGFSPWVVAVYALIYRVHAPLLHSNVNVSFGPLNRIVATPQFHHWHHADQPEAYDSNFAGQLSIIDRLFGTVHAVPGDALPERYGVSDGPPPSYSGQLLQPFAAVWKTFGQSRSTAPASDLTGEPALPNAGAQ